jgi:hypothetical protein
VKTQSLLIASSSVSISKGEGPSWVRRKINVVVVVDADEAACLSPSSPVWVEEYKGVHAGV